MATLKELLAQKGQIAAQQAAIEREIIQARQAERAGAIAEVKSLMAEHGLTLADLGTRSAAAPKAVAAKKVAAKYRNTATGDSWSGRGLQPNWLKRALVDGRSLDEFKV
jgi:DNA-binding protein H-NS